MKFCNWYGVWITTYLVSTYWIVVKSQLVTLIQTPSNRWAIEDGQWLNMESLSARTVPQNSKREREADTKRGKTWNLWKARENKMTAAWERKQKYSACFSFLISSIKSRTNLHFIRTTKFRGKVMIDRREYHQRVWVGGAPQSDCLVTWGRQQPATVVAEVYAGHWSVMTWERPV